MMLLLFICVVLVATVSALKTKTIVITGANRGVGYEAAKKLSANPNNQVILAVRDVSKGIAALQRIESTNRNNNLEVMECDLADLDSVSSFIKSIGDRPLHALCCNAGIQVGKGVGLGKSTGSDEANVRRTKQGYELTIGTNHISHFLMVKKLLPNLIRASKNNDNLNSRIIYTGSGVHNPEEPGGDVGSKATLGGMAGLASGFLTPTSMIDNTDFDPDKAYKDSKLCNVITSIETARRLKADKKTEKVVCNVFNPGLIPTSGLFRDLNPIFVAIFTFITLYVARVAVTEEEGGKRLASMVENPVFENLSGGYYSSKPGFYEFGPAPASREAMDVDVGAKLWLLTEKLVGRY